MTRIPIAYTRLAREFIEYWIKGCKDNYYVRNWSTFNRSMRGVTTKWFGTGLLLLYKSYIKLPKPRRKILVQKVLRRRAAIEMFQ